MTTDELIERAARIIADAALDWTDIENSEHEHSPECANWQPYTHEARAVLAVFEQAQAEHANRIELTPPTGWSAFGTHVDQPVALEFYGSEFTESGMPMWERPAQAEPEWEYECKLDDSGWTSIDDVTHFQRCRGEGRRRRKAGPWVPVEATDE